MRTTLVKDALMQMDVGTAVAHLNAVARRRSVALTGLLRVEV
jgi:hypothetical protein